MLKDSSQNIDDWLIKTPEVLERIAAVRRRFPDTEEGTDQFIQLVPFIQYGVPFGELLTLRDEGLLSREYREFDPIEGVLSDPSEDTAFFNRYVNSQATFDEGYSFIFAGANGSGKTMLALYLLCGFIERGFSGYYIHFKDYMRIYNDTVYANAEGTARLLKHLVRCDFLVIDEIGKESTTSDNVLGEFERLLKTRSAQSLPTVLITNLRFSSIKDEKAAEDRMFFAGRYKNSIANLLLHKYRFIQFRKDNEFRVKMRKKWQI